MDEPVHPGIVIDRILKERGIKKIAFAKSVGVSRAAVDQWIDGVTDPTLTNLIEISRVLNISLSAFGHPAIENRQIDPKLDELGPQAANFFTKRWLREIEDFKKDN